MALTAEQWQALFGRRFHAQVRLDTYRSETNTQCAAIRESYQEAQMRADIEAKLLERRPGERALVNEIARLEALLGREAGSLPDVS